MCRMIEAGMAFAAVFFFATVANGQVWIEQGDAGSLPGMDQPVFGCGPVFAIDGATGPGDFEDMFLIEVVDPDNFSISTTPVVNGGFADFDTQLWLFDINGQGIAANDDCPIGPPTSQSCIINIGPSGQNLLTQPGLYFVAISGFDNDPGNFNGFIFDQNPQNEITGPDGPGGFFPIEGWNGGGNTGNYMIQITGADFIIPPSPFEPGTKHEPPAAPCECEDCPDDEEGFAIDPVYLFSGEFYLDTVDLRIPGRGFDFVWARKYRARFGPQTEMGNGWDFSYNIRLEPCGPHLALFDGHTRSDIYFMQPNGTWAREEFFRVIEQNPDNTLTVTFPDTGTWNFNAFGPSPDAGKINSIVDRNGNTMTFDYDLSGRLVTVHDTLDTAGHNRDITITYNGDGLIQSVTDWTGRSVTYDYYEDGDAGGSAGDLKSVTTPLVTGTPNGNDFPSGKTTVYTYTTGFADETLNHDLLTITDPKGQTYLTNIYAHTINLADPRHTQDPANINFDRIVRQIWGNPGDTIDVFYLPIVPDPSNNFAVIETIINDRVGNVKEFFYDDRNRGVMQRIYTGRAPDPDDVTTDTTNRPTAQLRPGDPPFFETRFEFNNDSLNTRIVHPNGNEEIFVYDDANSSRRSQGNLQEHRRLPGPLGGDQAQISEFFVYDDDFGGCCGTNFVTSHTDGRGNVTTHVYDSAGNRTQTTHRIPSIVEDFEYNSFGQLTAHVRPDNGSVHRRRDEFTYYAAGPQLGYRQNQIIDATGFALTTTYEYDLVGNVTRTIDPRGHDTQYVFNQLDQVVREISREVTDGSGVRYERDTFYDANDNVIRVDIENTDDQGVLQANTHFSTIHEYEILNFCVRTCQEVGNVALTNVDLDCTSLPQSESIVTEFEYDANRNQTLVRNGEATDGDQPTNVVRTLYDERDLVFQITRAQGDVDQSTAQIDYDGNKNRTTLRVGLEDTPRITTLTYDGYDRLVSTTDAMGNTTVQTYDANHNRDSFRIDGELDDILGGAGNVRLSETAFQYDAMDRMTRVTEEFFDTTTQVAIGDGQSITQNFYSDNSQVIRVIDDNNHETLTTYDTANRRSVVTDDKNNTITHDYDANSNVVTITEVEKSDLLNPDETFVTTHVYDNLDRLTRATDNANNVSNYGYDSRNNLTVQTDANNNEIRFVFDGINRLVTTRYDLDGDGADGDGDDIVTIQVWDDASRLTSQTDDAGNATSYAYDALNRLTVQNDSDGTSHSCVYDVHDNKTGTTDANGNVLTGTYDLLNRMTNHAIVTGAGVSNDTTFELFKYDGLSRIIRAEDDDSVVTRSYDSLSRITSETLNGQTATSIYDGVGNRTQCTYPGGRVITCTYDELDRLKTASDGGGTIATYDYVGPDRVERREYGNGTRTDYEYDGILPNPSGDFGVKQIIRTTHSVILGGTIIDDRTYTWDPMFNKKQRKDIRPGGSQLTHDYAYDAIYRMTRATATDMAPTVVRDTDYDFDGVGNRTQVTGGPNPGSYAMNAASPDPADLQMNQYTNTAFDHRRYDANGNLISSFECLEGDVNGDLSLNSSDVSPFVTDLLTGGPVSCESDTNSDGSIDGLDVQRFIELILETTSAIPDYSIMYDYRNQMVEYADTLTGERHTYAYDALGRRITRILDADGTAGGPTETRYFYDEWQVIEEQNGIGTTQATYVYGLYIDEILNMQRGSDFYYHADDYYNVMALTNAAGTVVERYEYDDYGRAVDPTTLNPIAGTPSGIGNPYLFTGRRLDPETGWYYYRTRYLDPLSGRFTTRDSIGTWGDEVSLGNAFAFAGSNPWTYGDPFGMFCDDLCSPEGSIGNCRVTGIATVPIGWKKERVEGLKASIEITAKMLESAKGRPGIGQIGKMLARVLRAVPNVGANLSKTRGFKMLLQVEWNKCQKECCWVFWERLNWDGGHSKQHLCSVDFLGSDVYAAKRNPKDRFYQAKVTKCLKEALKQCK